MDPREQMDPNLRVKLHPWNTWTLDQRTDIARRHMIQAAREAEARGWMETHKAILMSIAALDDAVEAAHDPR